MVAQVSTMTHPDDAYSRLDYRRVIAWPQRIAREWPFLERILREAPSRRLLDLGCGTGEHAHFLAAHGFEVVGIDVSETMLAKARDASGDRLHPVRFIQGDIVDVEALVEGRFGAAICLGNTLPHVRHVDGFTRMARGLHHVLEPGAPLLVQILNYERIVARRERYLPLNFREEGDAEIVFLRLMRADHDGSVCFTPSTLRYRPDADPPLEVVASRTLRLRGWRRQELEDVLDGAGFRRRITYGTVGDVPYDAMESRDLVIVADTGV